MRAGLITKDMRDELRIEVWRDGVARGLAGVAIAPDFAAIVRSDRLPALFGSVIGHGGVVLAAIEGSGDRDELRGYAAVVPSAAVDAPWSDAPDSFELGSMEVARSSRGRGYGAAMLAELGSAVALETHLVFARGFFSSWDLGFAAPGVPAFTPVARQRQLLSMLAKIGFSRWDTDDPEVNDHPLNFLAVRAGRAAPPASVLALAERALGERALH